MIGGIAGALSGYAPVVEPPFDEPLALGWSREGIQLSEDAARILMYEARLTEVRDPLAGSYFVESLTNEIEAAAQGLVDEIESMGGAVAAIESGYMSDAASQSTIQRARDLKAARRVVVGVNALTGPEEVTVEVHGDESHPYDDARPADAESRQRQKLAALRRRRDGAPVGRALDGLRRAARKRDMVVVPPHVIECLRVDATVGEIWDALRGVFDERRGAAGE